jgi:methyl-accepting chemotaxis protein
MTRIVTHQASGTAEAVAGAFIESIRDQLAGEEPVLVVCFASTRQPLATLMPELQGAFPGAACIGSSTAGEFTELGDSKEGAVVWAIASDELVARAGIGTGLKENPEAALAEAIPELPDDLVTMPHRTAILLLDPLAGNGEEASLLASALLGPTVKLAGGAAGDDLLFDRAEVAAGGRSASNSVVVALLASARPLAIGVLHDHRPISGPITVTRSEGSTVHELDGRPAFDVWRDLVRSHAAENGVDIDEVAPEEIGPHLLRYEAGLIAGANEYKIRAPLSVGDHGSLNFACGLPEGAVIRITESGQERQVASARGAAERAREALDGANVAGALVFDCICRNLILGDQFNSAVQEIRDALGDVPLAGFETYGEIAMELGQMSGFHNTTTVVLAFPE